MFLEVTEVLKKTNNIGKSVFSQIISHNWNTSVILWGRAYKTKLSFKSDAPLGAPHTHTHTFGCRLSIQRSGFCQHVTVYLYIRSLENHLGDF